MLIHHYRGGINSGSYPVIAVHTVIRGNYRNEVMETGEGHIVLRVITTAEESGRKDSLNWSISWNLEPHLANVVQTLILPAQSGR